MKAIKGLTRIVIFSMIGTFLLSSGMLYSLAAGDGTPVFPHNFFGSVTIDGSPAPSGTLVQGKVLGVDKTYPSGYVTTSQGQYGSTTLDGKFGVDCTYGDTIDFYVAGHKADQTATCDPGADTNLALTVTISGCTPSQEVCDGVDNDCDGQVDEGLVQACGSGSCAGTKTCVAGSWGSCSSSGNDCGICAKCSATGSCDYDSSQNSDCNPNDIPGLDTCENNPDGNPFTRDFRAAFDSQCTGIGACSQGSGTITHTCSKSQCGAQCETNSDCSATDCDYLDGCQAGTYRDYSDVQNTCQASCQCTANQCGPYSDVITDGDQDGYDTQCDNDCNDADASIHPGAAEACDGKDNDCDGQTDEGCQCTNGQTQQCGQTDVGECAYGIQTCSGGAWGTCVGYVGPVTEVCANGLDDDCDGLADEGCSQQETYCLLITGMKVLNSVQQEDYTIPAGSMYYIEMSTYNDCAYDVQSMQIIQVLKGLMPVNLGSLESSIHPSETSIIKAGFIMPQGTSPGTGFMAKGFNWNHWIDQSPSTFEILSEPSQVAFQSE